MAAPSPEASEIEGAAKPFTFVQAAGFQRVNPRAWAMVLTAMSACMLPDRPMFSLAIIAVVFGLINLPSIFTWAVLGTQVRRFLNRPARLRAFNVTAALLLLASIWPILISSQIGGALTARDRRACGTGRAARRYKCSNLTCKENPMSSFTLYLIGFLIFIGGLAYGAYLLGLQPVWIGTGAVVLIGLGIITAVSKTRRRDESPANEN